MKKEKLLAILNSLAFIATIIVNGLANGLPINGKTTGELSDMYPNLFVPAGLTFSIWGLIYLLLLVFIVYQLVISFGKTSDKSLLNTIGPWFIISSLANCSWIFAWHYLLPGLSLLIMLVILVSLIKIYLNLNKDHSNNSYAFYLVNPCFSIYLGWITVATIANTTTVLVSLGWNGGAIDPIFWTIIMIATATFMGIYFSIIKKDPFYTLVIFWALLGIYLKRSADSEYISEIIKATQVGMMLCAISILYRPMNKLFKSFQ